MLRAVPPMFGSQFPGVVVMFGAIIMFFLLPWLDRSPVKSIRYKGMMFKVWIAIFVVSFVVLGWLGVQASTPTKTLPASLPLVTLDGVPAMPASLKGQWLLVVVIDSACDPACEQRLFMQRQLREMLGRDRDRLDKLVLVTDEGPLRPELRLALEAAVPATVLRVPEASLAAGLAPASGQPLQAHLYVVDPLGEWMMRMPPEAEPQRAMRDLIKLLRASAGWDKAGR
jgi:hypothetical protein